MNRTITTYLVGMLCCLLPLTACAQTSYTTQGLSKNPDKFLGNITTGYQMDYGSEKFYQLWNQVTPENETKWASIEGSARGQFNWSGADNAANYAKKYNFPFKFHTLIWGSQYPGWMDRLSTAEQYKAIVEWYDAVKKHYPNLEIIDVVNEAVAGHAPAPYKAALGGDGKTGYDWIIRAFELAHERWPDAILVYNDYNTFQWQKSQFIDLVRTLRDAGAPIDAYGCQSHDLTDMNFDAFKSAMVEIQNALKMPMYSTEYDIGTSDDNLQLQRYKEQIPYMFEADYCAGITLWGYIYGHTWTTDGNSGIIRDGKDRPAMKWLREYMATDAPKNATSPFPGMKKEASVYIKPATLSPTKGEPLTITVNARLRTKTIHHIDLYVKGIKYKTISEPSSVNEKTLDAAYEAEYTPATTGKYSLRAVVFDIEGNTYERLGSFTAYNPRSTFKGADYELPGTIEAENFDVGGDGVTYHDSNSNKEGDGASYRTDGGIDVVKGNGGYALGYTAAGEWSEYTVNVTKAGTYSYDAYVSAGGTGASFSLSIESPDGTVSELSETVVIPQTGNGTWDKYVAVHGRTLVSLAEGKHILRLNITGSNGNIDKFVFNHLDIDDNLKLNVTSDPKAGTVGEPATLIATSTADNIERVNFYVEKQLVKSVTEAPFEATYKPAAKGSYNVVAEALTTDGKVSKEIKYTLKVNNKRTPYSGTAVKLPGTIQAENFDKGGEGLTFHDANSEAEGDAKSYRSDAEGLDLVKGNNGTVIGYTAANEWTEYTVNVTEPGEYTYEATVSSGVSNSSFRISLVNANGTLTTLANVTVPQTGNSDWGTYTVKEGKLLKNLAEGQQILRITITGANCNIDKLKFNCVLNTAIDDVTAAPLPADGKKVLEDGRLVIYRGGKKYNALGVEVK